MLFCSSSQSSCGRSCHRETVQQADAELEPRTRRFLANNEMSHQGEARTRAKPQLDHGISVLTSCVWRMQRSKKWVGGKERWPPHGWSTSQRRHSSTRSPACRLWRATTSAYPVATRWERPPLPRGSRATPQREVCEYCWPLRVFL